MAQTMSLGPMAAAINVLDTGKVLDAAPIPSWTLALGGLGIVIGLATWGWRVIETVGKNITELTPTRGFSAEFATSSTVLVASALGLPISTTHTLVGAVVGVGMARGLEALNLGMAKEIFISWLVTVPAGAFLTVGTYYVIHFIFA
jgi:PiT family inorganic phosphate transporter